MSILLLSAFVTACSGSSGGGGTSTSVPKEFTQDFRSEAKSIPASSAGADLLASLMKQDSKVMPDSDLIFDQYGSNLSTKQDFEKLNETGRLLVQRIRKNCEIKPETRKEEGNIAAGSKLKVSTEKHVTGSACPVQISETSTSEATIGAVNTSTGEVSFSGSMSNLQTVQVTDPQVIASGSLAVAKIEMKATMAGDRLVYDAGTIKAGHGYSSGDVKGSFEVGTGGTVEKIQITGKAESISNASGTHMQMLLTFETSAGPVKMFTFASKDSAGKTIPEKHELIVNGKSYTAAEALEKFGNDLRAFSND